MTSAEENHSNEEEQEEEDGEAGLDDSMLAEIADDATEVDETEGFGHIKEDADKGEEEETPEAALEEDAEDVDYDSFDDEDHL
jgi:hypothetical protein